MKLIEFKLLCNVVRMIKLKKIMKMWLVRVFDKYYVEVIKSCGNIYLKFCFLNDF